MSRRTRRASTKSAGVARTLIALTGLVCLAGGAIGALVGMGVFGGRRALRPLLDPLALALLRAYPVTASLAAVLVAIVLIIAGIAGLAGSVRPESRPDLVLDAAGLTSLRVNATAITEAIAEDTQRLPGVGKAAARTVGTTATPALRITVWLTQGADITTIWRDIDHDVLRHARAALDTQTLPTAIRLELDRTQARTRVH